jgi:hypothetical protein
VQIRAAPEPGASLSPVVGVMLLALFDHSRGWHRRGVVESLNRLGAVSFSIGWRR